MMTLFEKNLFEIFLSLGSNLGDRKNNLEKAIQFLKSEEKIFVEKISSVYETKPWGETNQPDFLNLALVLKTELAPCELLDVTQSIEKKLGRERKKHWGERTIDLDLLLAKKNGEEIFLKTERLILPHPYLCERAFVLIPLREIAPTLKIFDKSIDEWCARVNADEIKKI